MQKNLTCAMPPTTVIALFLPQNSQAKSCLAGIQWSLCGEKRFRVPELLFQLYKIQLFFLHIFLFVQPSINPFLHTHRHLQIELTQKSSSNRGCLITVCSVCLLYSNKLNVVFSGNNLSFSLIKINF